MGMYTEIYISADLIENTPQHVIETLEAMCKKDSESEFLKDRPRRWSWLFNDGSYYTSRTEVGKLTYDHISNQWSIIGKGDIKNYKGEIELFFEWIKPYCEDGFLGFYRYEEDIAPTLVFKEGED